MTNFIPPRLRSPLLTALAGAAFAVAWAVRGGGTWWISIMVAVLTAVRVITVYVRDGRDTDEGALAGSRADERLKISPHSPGPWPGRSPRPLPSSD